MDFEFSDVAAGIEAFVAEIPAYANQQWLVYQIGIILLLFGVSYLLSLRIEPVLEEQARKIKGNPGLLRICVALLRRTEWILFVLLAAATVAVMRNVTWPSRSYILSLALYLAVAWLMIAVSSRIIRNRAIARSVAWIGWIYAAVLILGLTSDVAEFLDGLAVTVGSYRLSALLVVKAVVLLTLTVWLAVTIGNFVDGRIRRSEELSPSVRVLLGKVLKIGLVIASATIALSAIGVDLTAFTVFSGAVGVGIGFGLQKVVSNFISGIIILLDKSIKPGDTITLGDTFGWIRELRARFVSVVTRDGREFLIPNEDFITREVINWSFSDKLVRLDVQFGVSYDSDPHEVIDLAVRATERIPRVETSRKPVCWLTAFGDSSLDFVVRFWILDPQQGLTNIRGSVLLALWDTFKENGIGIPFPHREIIMKSPVEVKSGGAAVQPPDVIR